MSNLDEIDPSFKEDLKRSRKAVYIAAHWLNNRGHAVVIPANRVREAVEDRADYSDYGDLQIALSRDSLASISDFNGLEIVEVKQRFNNPKYPNANMDFKSRDEFPYDTVMVGIKAHYNKLDPEPLFTIIFNESLTGCLTIQRASKPEWEVAERWVEKNGRKNTCYECPKHLTTYYDINL
jgi:hypothetical protein